MKFLRVVAGSIVGASVVKGLKSSVCARLSVFKFIRVFVLYPIAFYFPI